MCAQIHLITQLQKGVLEEAT